MENQKDTPAQNQIESLLQLGSDLSVWFNSANNLVEALQLIIDSFCSIEGIDGGGIYVLNKHTSDLELLVHYGLPSDFITSVTNYSTDSPNYQLMALGKAVFVEVSEISDVLLKDIVNKANLTSLIGLPLQYENKLVGCINLTSRTLNKIEAEIQYILISLASQVASLIGRFNTQDYLVKMFRALEQIPEAVIFTNIKGEIEYVNPKFCEITGYTIQEVLGKNPRIQKSGRMNREEYKALWQCILTGNIWRGEMLNKKKNNELYWESISISPVFDHEKKIVGFVGVKEDITNKKALQEALLKSKEIAEKSNDFKSTLLNSLHNEFRTPVNEMLATINHLIDLIQDDKLKVVLNTAIHSGGKLINALDSILLLAQLTDPIELNLENLDIRNLIIEVIEDRKKKTSLQTQDFVLDISTGDFFVHADKRLLTLAFDKIIGNIEKLTDDVSLFIDLSKEFSDNKNIVVIKIMSSGLKLTPSDNQDIKYLKESKPLPHPEKPETNSIEYNVAAKIFEIFKGSILYQRYKSQTIEFKVSLPLVEQKRSKSNYFSKTPTNLDIPELPALIHELGRIPKVLLVEDNDMNAMLVHSMLSKTCNISHVKNSDKALELAGNEQFDLVLMDINLGPGLNGLQLTQEIRKNKNYLSTPFTAVTGYNMNDEMEKIFQAGINYYLGKPFKKEELIFSVRIMLNDVLQQTRV